MHLKWHAACGSRCVVPPRSRQGKVTEGLFEPRPPFLLGLSVGVERKPKAHNRVVSAVRQGDCHRLLDNLCLSFDRDEFQGQITAAPLLAAGEIVASHLEKAKATFESFSKRGEIFRSLAKQIESAHRRRSSPISARSSRTFGPGTATL